MTIQHFTNGELSVDRRFVGWAETYMQARTANPAKFPRIVAPHDSFVFWPATENRVRRAHMIVNERLYDDAGKLNESAIRHIAGK